MTRKPAAKIRVARIRINRNGTASYDPRELWVANVAPLVAAAREAASHAASAARAQRARASQPPPPWWQRRWLMYTATGLAVGGVAGAVYAMAKRGSQAKPGADELTARPEQAVPGGMRSTMEAGRDRVAGATRTMMHKIRNRSEATTAEQPTVGDHPRRNEMPATGTGYGAR